MTTTSVHKLLDQTRAKFEADPDASVARPSVTADLADGRARIAAGNFTFDADLGLGIGGGNQAPSPTAYLLGALAGCGVAFLSDTLAPLFGVTLNNVSATASCRSDAAGLLGIDGRDPAFSDLAITISVTSPDSDDQVLAMLAAWKERCPIYLALARPNAVHVEFEVLPKGR